MLKVLKFLDVKLSSKRYFSVQYSSTNMDLPIIYGDTISPPVRFVMMTASMLDIKFKLHKIDLFREENRSNFYKNINPLQKVPVLQVGDQIIRDSHAIALFLCGQKDNELYPSDPYMRAKVNEMLFLNSGHLFPIDSDLLTHYFAGKPKDENKVAQWNFLMDYTEEILKKQEWLAGNKFSLADICCATTISSLQQLIPPSNDHKNLNDWMKKLETYPCFAINKEGINKLKILIENKKS